MLLFRRQGDDRERQTGLCAFAELFAVGQERHVEVHQDHRGISNYVQARTSRDADSNLSTHVKATSDFTFTSWICEKRSSQ